MIGFKAFDSNLKCRGFQFELGKTYTVEGEIAACSNGFHFCKIIDNVYNYYVKGSRVCVVKGSGKFVEEGDKVCFESIEVLYELSEEEIKNSLTKNNSGSHNSGSHNSASHNSGYHNSGSHNSGNHNSGYHNSGSHNSGYHNSGSHNSGSHNSGSHNSGDCNTNEPTVRLFNKDSGWNFYDNNHRRFRLIVFNHTKPLLQWVYSEKMTDKEKEDNPRHKTTGGYLKLIGQKQSKPLNAEDKEFLLSVPNFDAEILFKTTGIKLESSKTIIIDGKEIEISEESYQKLKESLNE